MPIPKRRWRVPLSYFAAYFFIFYGVLSHALERSFQLFDFFLRSGILLLTTTPPPTPPQYLLFFCRRSPPNSSGPRGAPSHSEVLIQFSQPRPHPLTPSPAPEAADGDLADPPAGRSSPLSPSIPTLASAELSRLPLPSKAHL